jgi:hypothetical protein
VSEASAVHFQSFSEHRSNMSAFCVPSSLDVVGSIRPLQGQGFVLPLVLKAVKAYSGMLEGSPLVTKSVTCAMIAALGNVIAQLMQQVRKRLFKTG